MRKLIAILMMLILSGCLASSPGVKAPTPPPQEFVLKIVSDQPINVVEPDMIVRSMEVPNEEGKLSQLTFICDGVAHCKIFSGLSVSDVTRMWNDFCIIRSRKIKKVKLFINSPGGDAFSGLALSDEIERAVRDGIEVEAHASGIIASAAVPVLASCSKRYAAPGTIFMVHEAALWKWPGRETASDIRSQGQLMDLLRDRYMAKMVEHSTLKKSDWETMELKTSWFDAKTAKTYGIVDEIQ